VILPCKFIGTYRKDGPKRRALLRNFSYSLLAMH
jgi:hypothetical protein